MPPDDVILAKVEIIERCVRRIHEVYEGNPAVHNYRKLDLAIVQNLVEHRLGDFARFCAIAIGS
jgi:hypothetical protein